MTDVGAVLPGRRSEKRRRDGPPPIPSEQPRLYPMNGGWRESDRTMLLVRIRSRAIF